MTAHSFRTLSPAMLRRTLVPTVVAILLAFAGDAMAAAAAKPGPQRESKGDRLGTAWAKVVGYASSFLEEPQQKQLYDISYAAAVPGVCPAFGIDRGAVEKGFEQFDTPSFRKLSPDDQRKFEQRLLATYGVAVGLLLADGSLHEEEFCTWAEEQRTAPVGRYWLPAGSKTDSSAGPAVGAPRSAVPAAALPPAQSPKVLSAPKITGSPR